MPRLSRSQAHHRASLFLRDLLRSTSRLSRIATWTTFAAAAAFSTSLHAQTLAHAGAIAIHADDLRAAAQRSPAPSRSKIFGIESNVRLQAEELYLRRALAERARQQKLDADPIVAAQLQQLGDRLLSELLLQQIQQAATPDPAQLTKYAHEIYRSQPERYRTGEQVHARHILVMRTEQGDPRAEAAKLLQQIKEGASFVALAKAHSADRGSAEQGGDLGWFAPETMVKEFQAALAELQNSGELSGVVETQFGFHIIRLEGRRPAGQRSFEEVREQIEQEALTRNQAEARRALSRELLEGVEFDAKAIADLAAELGKPAAR
jgi:peptidyl-prolyl cis-trans isomerase C